MTGFGVYEDGELVEYELRPGEQGGHGGGVGDNPDFITFLGANPFSAPLDSIQPGVFSVFFRYVQLLPYDFGVMQLRYPLHNGEYLVDDIDTVSIRVDIDTRRALEELDIINYQEQIESEIVDENNAYLVMLEYDMVPEEDLGIDIVYEQEDIGAWLYTHRSDAGRNGYFILVIEPGIVDTGEAVEKYFTFVLDRSGSMSGNKIIQARQAVLNCMDNLLSQDFFNIIAEAYI